MKGIYASLLIVGLCAQMWGQQTDPTFKVDLPPTPEAAAMEEYTSVPVDMSTGIPNVSVPIFTVVGKGISVPISLSYHGGGVRVDEVATWVGLGWSLNAGGMITRRVKGAPDEDSSFGFLAQAGNIPNLEDLDYTIEEFEAIDNMGNKTLDGEADLFSYSFAGYSGKFFFDADGGVHCIPHNNLKIEYTSGLMSFTITTPQGHEYLFSTLETSPGTVGLGGLGSTSYSNAVATSWCLTKITNLANLDEITFEYTDYRAQYATDYFETHEYRGSILSNCDDYIPAHTFNWGINLKTDYGKDLSKITSDLYTVEFINAGSRRDLNMISGDHRLDRIVVKNPSDEIVKEFKLEQDFWQASSGTVNPWGSINPMVGTDARYRMYLQSVQEVGYDGTSKPPYTFDYDQGSSLPARLSLSQDHWGYYNGASNSYLTPDLEEIPFVTLQGADRSPDENYSKRGALIRLTYPTGGYTTFEYEAHTAGRCATVHTVEKKSSSVYSGRAVDPKQMEEAIKHFSISQSQPITISWIINLAGQGAEGEVLLYKLANYPGGPYEQRFIHNTPGWHEGKVNPQSLNTYQAGDYVLVARAKNGLHVEGMGSFAEIRVDYSGTVVSMTESQTVGGIRVRRMFFEDGSGPDIEKIYDYDTKSSTMCDAYSSGVTFGTPTYRSDFVKQVEVQFPFPSNSNNSPICPLLECSVVKLSSSSVHNLFASSGALVLYESVIEYTTEESGQSSVQNDYLINRNISAENLSNTPNFAYAQAIERFKNFTDLSWHGSILLRSTLGGAGGGVKETVYTYDFDQHRYQQTNYSVTTLFQRTCYLLGEVQCDDTPEDEFNYLGQYPRFRFAADTFWASEVGLYDSVENRIIGDLESFIDCAGICIWHSDGSQPTLFAENFTHLVTYEERSLYSDYGQNFTITQFITSKDDFITEFNSPSSSHSIYEDSLVEYKPCYYATPNASYLVAPQYVLYPYAITSYRYETGWPRLDQKRETYTGENGGTVIKTTDYTYNSDLLVSTESFVNSDGRTYTTQYKYPAEAGMSCMLTANMFGVPIEVNLLVGGRQVQGKRQLYTCSTPIAPAELYHWQGSFWDHQGTFGGHDADGYPSTFVSGEGYPTTSFGWDNGRLTSKVYSDFSWSYKYEDKDPMRVTEFVNIDGIAATYEYDGVQRLTNSRTRDGGISTSISYSLGAGSNAITTSVNYQGAGTRATTKSFDDLGRYLSTLSLGYDPLTGRDVLTDEVTYDPGGRHKTKTHIHEALTTMEYDLTPLNRLKLETLPDGSTISYQHFAEGNHYNTRRTDENGHMTQTFTDMLDRVTKVIDPDNNSTIYQYDDYGNVSMITTPAGQQYANVYDHRNLMTSKTVPGGGTSTYQYDDKERVTSMTDGAGRTTTYAYDEHDRIISTSYEGAVHSTTYGSGVAVDKVASESAGGFNGGGSSYSYDYDEYGRPKSTTISMPSGGSDMIKSTFDMADQLLTEDKQHPGIHVVKKYRYDGWGRQNSIKMQVEDSEEVTVASMLYNFRDQMVLKAVGGLQKQDFKYHETRGWLMQINDPLEEHDFPLLCDGLPPTTTPDPPGPDTSILETVQMDLEEILNARCYVEINVDGYETCTIKDCPDLGCTAQELADQQVSFQLILDTMRSTWSEPRILPCGPGETEVSVIRKDTLLLPFTIYRVRLCDNSERYVLGQVLDLLTGSYEIVQELIITNPLQKIKVEMEGVSLYLRLEEVLTYVLDGEELVIGDYINCGEETCVQVPPECNNQEVAAQEQLVEDLKAAAEQLDLSTLTYPVQLYRVDLCGGASLYVLEDELTYLEGTPYTTRDTVIFDTEEEEKEVEIDQQTELDLKDLLYMKFFYDPGNYGGAAQKNGNISAMEWQIFGRPRMAYGLNYDVLDRLTNATYHEISMGQQTSDDKYGVPSITYDPDGNILTLNRNGLLGICVNGAVEYGPIDQLTYAYGGNRLTSVSDGATENGFYQGGGYSYDGVGNMTSDPKGLDLTYNHVNLPQTLSGHGYTFTWNFDAAGRKWEKTVAGPDESVTYKYLNGIVYRNDELQGIYHEDGRVIQDTAGNWVHEFHLKDHLGNVRVVFSDRNLDGNLTLSQDNQELVQETHYYPFGMAFDGLWFSHPDSLNSERYLYNGKEQQTDSFDIDADGIGDFTLGWYDYGARFYDPAIGRFTGVDVLADAQANVTFSPYTYVWNNPINAIDPDGRNGILLGSGTEDDPYTVKANYYVVKGSLSEDELSTLQTAIGDYNSSKGDLKFKLSIVEVDSKADAQAKIFGDDMFEDETGEARSYGNLVTADGGSSDDALGSATTQGIAIASDRIGTLASEADLSKNQTNAVRKSVWTHEIGHNLGLDHSDNTKTMNQVNIGLTRSQIGANTTATMSLPKLDKRTSRIILSKAGNRALGDPGIFRPKR